MRREGRQHGTVRTTASGVDGHAKAPTKPTGHSKHTGKCKKARCGQCHTHPVSKSRDKAKGTYKLKCGDVVLNHHLVSWRVAGDRSPAVLRRWSKYSGESASGVLDALMTDSGWSQGDDDVRDEEEDHYDYGDGLVDESSISSIHGNEEEEEEEEHDDDDEEEEHHDDDDDDDDDDDMGFYEVGFVWEYIDEEDWCVVSEM